MNPTLPDQPPVPPDLSDGTAEPNFQDSGPLPPYQEPPATLNAGFGPDNSAPIPPSYAAPTTSNNPGVAYGTYHPQETSQNGQPTQPPNAAAAGPKINPNSTQNALQIAEIRDGIVIMNDGSFRSVIMVKSINFDLMSPQEREAVEYSYQAFLNSLYFPVQIFIHSRKVDLGPYIQKLDKIRTEHENMLLAMLMEDYINYMDQLAMQTNIMDKKFYVVIPFFPTVDVQKALAASRSLFSGLSSLFNKKEQHVVINEEDLEKAKAELRNRVQAVLGGLLQCNIQGIPLDTQELIELYYDVYNPDTATRQELKNFNSLNAPVITKGQGQAPQPNLDRELQ